MTRIQSYQGPEHCGWDDITFLRLGPEDSRKQYLRDTTGELDDYLRTSYDRAAVLPDGATDTGFHRHGRQLWLGGGHNAAYLVDMDDPNDVERWLAPKDAILCA